MNTDTNVLIIGGGITGLTAAVELSRMGRSAVVLERKPFVGGLCADFACKATDKCAQCGLCLFSEALSEARECANVTFMPGSDLEHVERADGKYVAKIVRRPPRVVQEKCTLCGECVKVCPVQPAAIGPTPPLVFPAGYAIDENRCIGVRGKKCTTCRTACKQGAIREPLAPDRVSVTADSIIVAAGAETFDARKKAQFRLGSLKGVLTGLELEKALQSSGELKLPGLETPPKRLAFIQCVGSRDESLNHCYCSTVCCRYAIRMAHLLKTKMPALEVAIFYMDIQTSGKGFADFFARHQKEFELIRSIPGKLVPDPNGGILASYDEVPSTKVIRRPFDAVVLSVGLCPPPQLAQLAKVLKINRNKAGFLDGSGADRVQTNADGVFVAGTCESPKDIVGSIAQAKTAAGAATAYVKKLV
ncbi:MAG: FAD-dependent oxidoreductase [Planctomycetota bacterium]|nr:FAD-dependent oxidoreductase [Planctomycetota bacterium]